MSKFIKIPQNGPIDLSDLPIVINQIIRHIEANNAFLDQKEKCEIVTFYRPFTFIKLNAWSYKKDWPKKRPFRAFASQNYKFTTSS